MADQSVQSDLQQMITSHQEHPPISFPKIQSKRISPGRQSIPKNMTSLPALQNNKQIKEQMRLLKMLKQAQYKDEQQIVDQIQQKMKQVLEILNSGGNQQQNINNQNLQFEDEIKLNREKIKYAISSKERKLQINNSPSRQLESNSRQRHVLQRYQNKNKPNFNKRSVSSYQDNALHKQNKLQEHRKKRSVKLQENRLIQYKKEKSGLQPRNSKKIRAQTSKKIDKPLKQSKQQENIFDGIQNMLQNPKIRFHSVESHGNQNNQIEKLQKKLRILNQKLSKNEQYETKQSFMGEQLINNTVHDWKRLSYNRGKFVCRRDSNFQRQIQKVIRLQSQNEQKIGDFINNQLQLINLNYLKRAFSKMNKNQ